MIDTLISLVGKQPMPVLIPILQFKPKKNWLIVTPETEEYAQNIREAIKSYNENIANVEERIDLPRRSSKPVSPYSSEEVEQEISKVCQASASSTYINITGGTSMMSLGAYNAARKNSLPMIYVNTDDNQIMFLSPDGKEKNENTDIDLKLSLKEYLKAHGATCSQEKPWGKAIMKNEPWINPFIETANRIGKTYSRSAPLMDAIRESYQKRGKNQKDDSEIIPNPSPEIIDLAHYLYKNGFLSHCSEKAGGLKVNVNDQASEQERIKKFLEGVWLEIFVYKTLCESKEFDEVLLEVSIKRKISSETEKTVENEIDVIAMLNSRLAAISCKTGKILSIDEKDKRGEAKEVLYELDSLLQADLMGLYAKKILVTNQENFRVSLKDRAVLSKIKLLNGTHLPDLVEKVKDVLRKG